MRIQNLTRAIAAVAVVVAGATIGAQAPTPKDMAELLATLREPKLPERRKQALIRGVYAGSVEVLEIQEVSPSPPPDRSQDSIRSPKPTMRIMVDVGASNPYPLYLAFETTDIDRARKLRKGDRVTVTGKLVKFVQHRNGYNGMADEWLIFDEVVLTPALGQVTLELTFDL
jgi:hypothetical protein